MKKLLLILALASFSFACATDKSNTVADTSGDDEAAAEDAAEEVAEESGGGW